MREIALAPAQESLRREVNPNVYPALEFRKKLAARDPFACYNGAVRQRIETVGKELGIDMAVRDRQDWYF